MSSWSAALLLFAHLLAAIVWLGGMIFAHFVLRPAAVALLAPPQRLPLLAAALGRFFRWVAVAVPVILVSGLWLMSRAGFAHSPVGWHLMLGLGLSMAGVFAFIFFRLAPRLQAHVAEQAWPAAGAVLDRIRRLVTLNLWLGIATVGAAASPASVTWP